MAYQMTASRVVTARKRIAVVGAGAMGGAFAARLAEEGHDVLLVDVSPAVVSAIEKQGLRLMKGEEARSVDVRATRDPQGEVPADVVIFFVKNYHTEDAARLALPLVNDETTVVSLQNGWGNGDILARTFLPAALVIGVTYHSATVVEPGAVAHTGHGTTHVGPYVPSAIDRAAALADVFRTTGFPVELEPDVRGEIWKKLILNSATLPTSALTRLTAGALGEPGALLDLVDGLAVEAGNVARAAGIDIDIAERLESIHATLHRAGPGKPSMLQDVEACRRTEIDVINGAVVREAGRLAVDVPLNRVLYTLVCGLERGLGLR
jgi:2-dehydropantoate 2-reductase